MLKVSIMTTGGKRSLYFITLASLFGWWRFIVVGYAALGVGLRSLKAPFFLVLFHVSYQISMPVEVFVQTDERSPLSFLMKPLSDQIAHAFRER